MRDAAVASAAIVQRQSAEEAVVAGEPHQLPHRHDGEVVLKMRHHGQFRPSGASRRGGDHERVMPRARRQSDRFRRSDCPIPVRIEGKKWTSLHLPRGCLPEHAGKIEFGDEPCRLRRRGAPVERYRNGAHMGYAKQRDEVFRRIAQAKTNAIPSLKSLRSEMRGGAPHQIGEFTVSDDLMALRQRSDVRSGSAIVQDRPDHIHR